MHSETRPAIFRIIMTNYICFLAVFSPLVLWAFFLLEYFQGEPTDSSVVLFYSLFTLAGLVVALWKIFSIVTIINYGQQNTAVVHSVGFFRGRGHIQFVYTYQGEKYMTKNTVLRNKHTQKHTTGEQIQIFVNPNNPKNAVVKDIYTK